LILDFQAALKGAILIALARGRRKIGFGPGMEHQEHSYWFLNETIPAVDMETHALERGLMLLEAIGIPAVAVEYQLPIDSAAIRKADTLIQYQGQINPGVPIAINPVAQWETKLWLPERFAELADLLIERHQARIFFTGSPADRSQISQIIRGMRHGAQNLAGATSLVELAALYRRMAMVITTDTGPMHIAAAVDTPVVALFGPTAEWRTGPYGENHHIVAADVACRPCFKRTCSHCSCMQRISVDEVMLRADALLKG
jgi:heptosyltransferase-1